MTPERDECTEKTLAVLIANAIYAADTTPVAVATEGWRGATISLHIGVGGITFTTSNKVEFVLTHSDDGTTYTNVTDTDVIKDSLAPATITNGIIRALTAAHAADTVQKLGYIGGKAFVKLLADFSGTHGTGTAIAASLVLEEPHLEGAI